ncbi:MAG TPA: hypothetical protein EYG40_06340 [Verrucomicrobia bacterium]|nr:hypothetical protein [Verrucomicrobiales bacterium]HIL54640.1 hypothetical protein [Verrucomicrobiota bacterium]
MNFFLLIIFSALVSTVCLLPAQSFNEYGQSPHNYWESELEDPMSELLERVRKGEINLDENPGTPLVRRLLEELQISKSSQILVFSRTSLQRGVVSPTNPRAIYFNDEVYLGWMPNGRIEIASLDSEKGFIFFFQRELSDRKAPLFSRDKVCIQCHAGSATNFLPGPLGRSVFPDSKGRSLKSVDTFELIGHEVPVHERWGGWYVTRAHQDLNHMGNAIAVKENGKLKLQRKDSSKGLNEFFNTSNYPVSTSEIESLLVFDHQVRMQFVLIESAYKVRQAIFDSLKTSSKENSANMSALLKEVTDTMVSELLFKEEFPLGGKIVDTSQAGKFVTEFKAKGKTDSRGRSLRDLDLQSRLFKYRCSYMIYSKSFRDFPKILKNSVLNRIKEIMTSESPQLGYEYLEAKEKKAIFDILSGTLAEF